MSAPPRIPIVPESHADVSSGALPEAGQVPVHMTPQAFKVACSNCNLRELCMPMGLDDEQMERIDEIVATRRKVKRGGLLWYAPDQEYHRGERVFAPFFVLLEKHGDKVEPHLPKEEPTGLSARALQFLYRTDLDSFGRKRG